MVFNSEHHHFEFEKILHDKMSKIYIFQAIMTFIKSSIGIFVPIYLFSLGYSIISVFFYVIGISITYLLLIPFSVRLINKIGFKNSIFLSLPIYFLHILSLNYVDVSYFYFILASFSFGLYMAIFWPAMHSEIAVNGSAKHRGSQMGTLQILTTMFATISPLVGGYILERLGYPTLLIFSFIFLIIGSIPLYFAKDIKLKNFHFYYKDYFRLARSKKLKLSKNVFCFEGASSVLTLSLWSIILYILLKNNFLSVGLVFTLASFITVLILFYFKRYLDSKNKNGILKISTKFLSISWYLRSIILIFSGFFIYFIEVFSKMVFAINMLTYNSIFYNNAKRNNYMEYIILRELYLHTTKILFLLFYSFILFYFGDSIKVLFFIVILGILFPLGISYFKEE